MSVANKLIKIAENMVNVFNKGKIEGYDEGFKAGEQAEYTAFWDEFFENGNR